MAKLRNRIVEAGSKANIRKTAIELAEEQCFFEGNSYPGPG
jgi:hypothetical protein